MILEFRHELEALINKHNRESVSNTPDFILCQFVMDALAAFDKAVCAREKWHGRKPHEYTHIAEAPDAIKENRPSTE